MKERFGSLRHSGILASTIFFILICFGVYYYTYVDGQTAYFIARDVRQLSTVASRIQSTIDAKVDVLTRVASTRRGLNATEYLTYLTSAGIDFPDPDQKATLGFLLRNNPTLQLTSDSLTFYEQKNEVKLISFSTLREPDGSLSDRNPLTTQGQPVLFRTETRIELGGLVDPATINGVCDKLFLVHPDSGKVFYQNESTPLRVATFESLTAEDGKQVPFRTLARSTNVATMDLAGTTYQVFMHPFRVLRREGQEPKTWVVVGVTERSALLAESLKIPYTYLLVLALLILLVTAAWPILKLRLMGPKEELRAADVLFVMLSGLLGPALITFLLADVFIMRTTLGTELDQQLVDLGKQIETNFNGELARCFDQLQFYVDRSSPPGRMDARDAYHSGLLSGGFPGDAPHQYPWFDRVYLIDDKGDQVRKWTIDTLKSPLVNLSVRPYYANLGRGIMYRRSYLAHTVDGDTATKTQDFWLEPHTSWSTGRFEMVISVPATYAGDAPKKAGWVIAMDTGPWSLYKSTLPDGYSFCVLDENAGVLFHSREERNLSEDFFSECEDASALRSAVFGRNADPVTVTYWGKKHRASIRPIADVPWTIVVLRDEDLIQTMNLEALTGGFILYVLYAAVFIILVTIFYIRKGWHVEWVWPDAQRRESYLGLAVVFMMLWFVFLVLRSAALVNEDNLLLLTVLLTQLPVALAYNVLATGNGGPPSGWRVLWNRFAATVGRRWTLWASLPVIAYLIVTYVMLGGVSYGSVWTDVVVIALLTMPVLIFGGAGLHFRVIPSPNGRTAYTFAGACAVILIAVQPALNFFKLSADVQLELFVKHHQLRLARELQNRRERLAALYAKIGAPQMVLERRLDDTLDVYAGFFFDTHFREGRDEQPGDAREITFFRRQVHRLIPRFNDVTIQSRGVLSDYTPGSDRLWSVTGDRGDSLEFSSTGYFAGSGWKPVYTMTTFLPTYQSLFEGGRMTLASWMMLSLIMSLLLVATFSLVKLINARVFLINAHASSGRRMDETRGPLVIPAIVSLVPALPEPEAPRIHRHAGKRRGVAKQEVAELPVPSGQNGQTETLAVDAGQNLLVLGTASRSREEWLDRIEAVRVDLRSLQGTTHPDEFLEGQAARGQRVVVLEHFEHAIHDTAVNTAKLQIVESLAYTEGTQVVVTSTVDPMSRLEETEDATSLDRWRSVMNSFARVRFPEPGDDAEFAANVRKHLDDRERDLHIAGHLDELRTFILEECRNDGHLQSIALDILDELDAGQLRERRRELFLELLMERACTYYNSLWLTCSREERRVLVHLARHGYANAGRISVIEELMRRGLVRRTPALRLMNISFRLFVLDVRTQADTAIPRTEAGSSAWGKLRVPMLIALAAVLIFLYYTQKEFVSWTMSLLTILGGLLPAAFKVFSAFESDKAGTPKER